VSVSVCLRLVVARPRRGHACPRLTRPAGPDRPPPRGYCSNHPLFLVGLCFVALGSPVQVAVLINRRAPVVVVLPCTRAARATRAEGEGECSDGNVLPGRDLLDQKGLASRRKSQHTPCLFSLRFFFPDESAVLYVERNRNL
jgi:hypothetical protein